MHGDSLSIKIVFLFLGPAMVSYVSSWRVEPRDARWLCPVSCVVSVPSPWSLLTDSWSTLENPSTIMWTPLSDTYCSGRVRNLNFVWKFLKIQKFLLCAEWITIRKKIFCVLMCSLAKRTWFAWYIFCVKWWQSWIHSLSVVEFLGGTSRWDGLMFVWLPGGQGFLVHLGALTFNSQLSEAQLLGVLVSS